MDLCCSKPSISSKEARPRRIISLLRDNNICFWRRIRSKQARDLSRCFYTSARARHSVRNDSLVSCSSESKRLDSAIIRLTKGRSAGERGRKGRRRSYAKILGLWSHYRSGYNRYIRRIARSARLSGSITLSSGRRNKV